ncbi:MAG: ribokinase [Anaerolineales bacterium]|nr:ribokinase [Anaerolineales bacterium]
MPSLPYLLIIGSLNLDLVVRAPHLPAPGETVLGTAFDTFPGGKGANQAVAAARQGARVAMLGCLGQDDFGRQLLASLQAEGIDHTGLQQLAGVPSGVALITLDAAGQNSIVVAPGANAHLSPAHIEQASGLFTQADLVLLQLEIPLETVLAAARLAKEQGCRVLLNPAPAQRLPEELLSLVDVLIPNQSEAALLTGRPVDDLPAAQAAAAALLQSGPGALVLTLGAQGALVAQVGTAGQGPVFQHVPAFPVQVVDTTAAGDSFCGTLAVALAEGQPLPQATRRACAAGALAASRLGAQPSLPRRAEVDDWVGSFP